MAHDVHGKWEIVQSNGYRVEVDITQSQENSSPLIQPLIDGPLTGTADEITPHGTDVSHVSLTGNLFGDTFEILVDWQNGTQGQYVGHFDAFGHLSGVTYDVKHPTAQATWFRPWPPS